MVRKTHKKSKSTRSQRGKAGPGPALPISRVATIGEICRPPHFFRGPIAQCLRVVTVPPRLQRVRRGRQRPCAWRGRRGHDTPR